MLEHLSSLRRKNSESAQATSNDKQAVVDHKDVNDIDTVNSKTRNNIFKNLISDNGASNIFQNLIKCPENISSHLSTAMSSSSTNGSCKPKTNNHEDDDNNNQQTTNVTTIVQPCANESGSYNVQKKRNSTVKLIQNSNGDLNVSQRELSPSPRPHRKSSHDIRLLRNNQTILESGEISEVGKVTGVKPLKTKNIMTKNETFDTLHCRAIDVSMRMNVNKLRLISLIMHQNSTSSLLYSMENLFNLIYREKLHEKPFNMELLRIKFPHVKLFTSFGKNLMKYLRFEAKTVNIFHVSKDYCLNLFLS